MSPEEISELYMDLTRRSKRLLEPHTIDKMNADFARAKAEYRAGNIDGGFALKEDVLGRLRDFVAEIEDVLCGLNVLSEEGDVQSFVRQARAACIRQKAECAELLTKFEDDWQTSSNAYWRQLRRR
ncbi:MAG TPA: hypothetical protein VEG65_05975 [Candidatus Bathyarchaeia archaeon]|nr:hypothetical protein [Candidatus Bathyarchaeia archaeon]